MIDLNYFRAIKQHFAEGLFEKTLSYNQAKELAELIMSHVPLREMKQHGLEDVSFVQPAKHSRQSVKLLVASGAITADKAEQMIREVSSSTDTDAGHHK